MERNTFTAFLSVAGSRLAIIVASVFITPLLFRLLGAGTYGKWATVMSVFGLLMILVSSGINGGSRKFLSEKRDIPHWQEHVFSYFFVLAAVLALLAAGGLALAAWTGLVASTLGPEYTSYFYLLAVLTIVAQFRSYVRRSLMGLKLEHLSEPMRVAHKVLFGVFAVSFAWLGYGVKGVLVGEILASSGVIIIASIAMARELTLSRVVEPLPSEFPKRELIDFNNSGIVYHFLMQSLIHVDVLMLGYFLANSSTVGVYKGALVIVQLLWILPKSVQSVMVQTVSDHWANDRIEKINAISHRVVRYTTLLSILLSIGLAALAYDFVPLYLGEEGQAAVEPLLLLIPGTLFYAIGRPVFAISYAKGEMRTLILVTSVAAGVNFVMNAALIPTYGMYGAAVATTTGYATLPLAHTWGARVLGYKPFGDFRGARILATTVIGAVPIVGLSLLIQNTYLALAVVPPVGLLVFGLATVLTGAMHLSEIVDLLDSLPEPVSRFGRYIEPYAEENRSGLAALQAYLDAR
ncbi:oligosaccharide flippase family protein [Haloarcula nitratireducens]|uniref:Oligosaccharide flippase family protein n=1 Tax=Haloarcula nitratireducens TaxID=2487749 RepID=A0AAW4PCV8_9EURY|nr:oligosaccharide flippase family protein [Halomicroarcula nitratireducens]MBX0295741.1 oligosaccharide flippase family protein [Halomicroarcula nitratireducens]